MRRSLSLLALAGASLFCVWAVGRIAAQEPSQVTRSARGGALFKSSKHQFEVFCYPTGLRVFVVASTGAPVNAAGLNGTATFYHPNSPNAWFERPLRAAPAGAGQPSPSLDLAMDLTPVPLSGARVAFAIKGLPDRAETSASFTVPFAVVGSASASASQASEGAAPRYSYGTGYYGTGYYENAGPQSAPTAGSTGAIYRGYAPHLGHRPTYDWSVGRDNVLAKPWLRPWD